MRRIIPSIYISDSLDFLNERKKVLDYSEGLELAMKYASEGADEVILMDLSSANDRGRNVSRFIKDAAKNLTIPFAYGGGVHTVKDVEELLELGVPRVYVNSAAVRNPELINKITSKNGKQALLVAIDTRKTFGKWKVYLNGGKSRTEMDLLNWIKMSELRGAGELLISAIKRTNDTQDNIFDLFREIIDTSEIPIIASIGVSSLEDFRGIFSVDGLSGVVTAHYFADGTNKIMDVKNYLGQAFHEF